MMQYTSDIANVVFDDEAQLFHGEVLGIKDVITFQGTDVKELVKAFHDSVNDYLAWCKERGEQPEETLASNTAALTHCIARLSFFMKVDLIA